MRNTIKNTKVFKNLEPYQQSIYGNQQHLKKISEEYIVAKNTGEVNKGLCVVYKKIINEMIEK